MTTTSPGTQPEAALACPGCGSVLASNATLCAACGSPLTVELSIAPIADPKNAYQTARRVAEFGASGGAPGTWAKSLQTFTLRVASTRGWDETVRFVAELSADGVQAAVRLTAPVRPRVASGFPMPRIIAVSLAVVVFAGGAALLFRDPAPAPAPQPAAVFIDPNLPAAPPSTAGLPAAPDSIPVAGAQSVAEAPAAAHSSLDFDAIRRSIVLVSTAEGTQGTGFVVAPGVIVTNRHVVGDHITGSIVDVTFGGGEKVSARVARVAKRLDLAVVQCSGACEALPALPLGKLASTPLGATVFALGNPFGLTLTLSKGIVSSKERNLDGILFVQSDVSVNPGNSGGPLFNEQGEVLGVVTAKATYGEGITFVLPIEYAVQGGDAVLDGFVPVDESFSADMLALMEQAKVNPGESSTYRSRTDEAPDEEIQLAAAAGNDTAYAVRFLLRLGPSSQANTTGPFYIVMEQANGYRGVFPMSNVGDPRKVGESQQGGVVYLYEHRGALPSGVKLAAGDKVAVRFRDDRLSNKVELGR